MTENPLDYVVSLSNLIKQQESRRKLASDLLVLLAPLITAVVIITVLDQEVPAIIFYVIGSIFLIYLVYVARWIGEYVLNVFTNSTHYKWNLSTALVDWTFQGILDINSEEKCLVLTDSDAGCILKNKSWRNFDMTFEFNVKNDHGFGLIFHAKDADSYIMFKIQTNQKIIPHYRNKDGWQILYQGIGDEPVGGIENKWNVGKLTVYGKEVILSINEQNFYYVTPNNAIINHVTNSKNALNNPLVVPITCTEGSIGFRAHSTEKVLFRNITIKNITKKEFAAKGKVE